jgi:predicted dehydrogenase
MLRVGLVGTGLIATLKHLPAWRRASRRGWARVAAVCDSDPARAKAVAAAHGVPAVYDDVAEMCRREALDAVDVCTPPASHAQVVVSALEARAHVLVEKPMATSVAECDAMIAAARRASRVLSVAHSDLFYPAFLAARRRLQRGDVGEFRGMRILLATPASYITARPEHWAHRLPGGVMGETGPHAVYMTLAFIPRIAAAHVRARKVLPEYPWSPYEDYRIELEGEGASSSIALTYTTRHWAAQVELWGEDGILRADLESQSVGLYRRGALTSAGVGLSTVREAAAGVLTAARAGLLRATGRALGTHDALVQRFAAAIRDGAPPPVTAEDGREAVRVLALLVDGLERQGGMRAGCAESAAS